MAVFSLYQQWNFLCGTMMYQLPYYGLVTNFCMSSEVLLLLNPHNVCLPANVYRHIMLSTPVLVRSLKFRNIEPC